MSLIPSESYSFPDHFTSTVSPSRKPKEEKTEKVEAPPKKPQIVALPDPTPEPSPMLMVQESQFFAEEQPMEMAPIEPVRPQPPPQPANPPVAVVRTQPGPTLIEQESQLFADEPPMEMSPPTPIEPVRSYPPPPLPKIPIAPIRPKPAPPNPAVLRATAPPPKVPDGPIRKMPFPAYLKPKVRWNNRAPAIDPAPARQESLESAPSVPPPNIIPMQPKPAPLPPPRPTQSAPRPAPQARPPQQPPAIRKPIQPPAPAMREPSRPAAPPPAPEPRPVQAKPVTPKPQALPTPNPQADFFEVFAESSQEAALRRRREMKFRRFIACEVAALVVLVPLVILGLALDITSPAVRWMMNLFTIVAAISAAAIPIAFYAFTPTLPELER